MVFYKNIENDKGLRKPLKQYERNIIRTSYKVLIIEKKNMLQRIKPVKIPRKVSIMGVLNVQRCKKCLPTVHTVNTNTNNKTQQNIHIIYIIHI